MYICTVVLVRAGAGDGDGDGLDWREGKGREGKGREGKGREGKGREGKGREGILGVGGLGQGGVEDMCGLEYAGWMVWMGVIRGTRGVADEHGRKDPMRTNFSNFKTPRRCPKCLTPSARGNNHPSHNPDINYLTPSLPSSNYNFSEPPTTAFQFTNPSLVVPEILVPLALSPPLPLSTLTTTGPVWPLNGTEKCVIPAAVAW